MSSKAAERSARLLSGQRRDMPAAASEAGSQMGDAQLIPLKDQAQSVHEEARMVLPGIQALFGFQLIVVFNRPFFDLGMDERVVHLVSLVLVAVAIGLIMAPAAYHRLVERDRVSRYWIRLASRSIAWAMVALMVAISMDTYLVGIMIVRDFPIAVAIASAVAIMLAWLWFALPWLHRHRADLSATSSRR